MATDSSRCFYLGSLFEKLPAGLRGSLTNRQILSNWLPSVSALECMASSGAEETPDLFQFHSCEVLVWHSHNVSVHLNGTMELTWGWFGAQQVEASKTPWWNGQFVPWKEKLKRKDTVGVGEGICVEQFANVSSHVKRLLLFKGHTFSQTVPIITFIPMTGV